jgi:hypothetical protein
MSNELKQAAGIKGGRKDENRKPRPLWLRVLIGKRPQNPADRLRYALGNLFLTLVWGGALVAVLVEQLGGNPDGVVTWAGRGVTLVFVALFVLACVVIYRRMKGAKS